MINSLLAFLLGCALSGGGYPGQSADVDKVALPERTITQREREEFKAEMTPLLKSNSWEGTSAYAVGHVLMVPLHAAFQLRDEEWMAQFKDHFDRFASEGYDSNWTQPWPIAWRQGRIQYLYLYSRYLVLAAQNGQASKVNLRIPEILSDTLDWIWNDEEAVQYVRKPFPNLRERVLWKLDNPNPDKLYYRALLDDERFIMAIAGDLKRYSQLTGTKLPAAKAIDDVLEIAYRCYRQYGEFLSDDRWLIQPGAWTDHPDYAYAGQREKVPGMSKMPRFGISEDISHSHRTALWLSSMGAAFPATSEQGKFFRKARAGLEKQFVEKALVKPSAEFPGWRTTNYLDGWNGVYRYAYKSLGGGETGYGPYQVSDTLFLGWWTFLGSQRMRRYYADMASRYPLPAELFRTYFGYATDEVIGKQISNPTRYNQQKGLITSLASKIVDTAE